MARFVNDQAVLRRGDGPFRPFGGAPTLRGLLFPASEPGFTFEPWDITTLYQDRAGTTPVTAAGQSVGLRLDKSKQTYFEPRRNRLTYTEQFDNAAWTKSAATVTADAAVAPDGTTTADKLIESSGVTRGRIGYGVATAVGNTISVYAKAAEWNRVSVGISNNAGLWGLATFNLSTGLVDGETSYGGVSVDTPVITPVGNGWYRCSVRVAAGTDTPIIMPFNQSGDPVNPSPALTGDGTSGVYIWGAQLEVGSTATAYQAVTEFPTSWLGNHQVAVSDAKRGVYGWMPKTGRRNLLTYTEDLSNAVWVKTAATITANAETAPDGTLTADRVEATGIAPNVSQDIVANSTSVTLSAYFKKGTDATAANALLIRNQTLGTNLVAARVNLDTGAITYLAGSSGAASESVGNGWWKLTLTASITSGNTVRSGILGGYAATVGNFSFIWGAQLELGSTATAYQRVASQYDITEAGVPTCYYVQADGVDDAYVTPTITPNTDKVQVFAGIRKLSDAAIGVVAEFSTDSVSNNGAIGLFAPAGTVGVDAQRISGFVRGTAGEFYRPSATYVAPTTRIVTLLADIAGVRSLRLDGVAVDTRTTVQSSNFLAYPAYIYGRAGTSLPFNGLDFGHAVRFGPNLDAATIARVESLIARNTPEVTL